MTTHTPWAPGARARADGTVPSAPLAQSHLVIVVATRAATEATAEFRTRTRPSVPAHLEAAGRVPIAPAITTRARAGRATTGPTAPTTHPPTPRPSRAPAMATGKDLPATLQGSKAHANRIPAAAAHVAMQAQATPASAHAPESKSATRPTAEGTVLTSRGAIAPMPTTARSWAALPARPGRFPPTVCTAHAAPRAWSRQPMPHTVDRAILARRRSTTGQGCVMTAPSALSRPAMAPTRAGM